MSGLAPTDPAPPAVRYRPERTAVTLRLTAAERLFLSYRLADAEGIAQVINDRDMQGQMRPRWPVERILQKIDLMHGATFLPEPILMIGELDRAIIVEAFEGNRFLIDMAGHDEDFTSHIAACVKGLRRKLEQRLGRKIKQPAGATG